jgi:hypothetical protein
VVLRYVLRMPVMCTGTNAICSLILGRIKDPLFTPSHPSSAVGSLLTDYIALCVVMIAVHGTYTTV